jgi:hypothetical protein
MGNLRWVFTGVRPLAASPPFSQFPHAVVLGAGCRTHRLPLRCHGPDRRGLRAVQSGQVVLVDGNQHFNRPGPRLVDALEWLVALLAGRTDLLAPDFPWEWLRPQQPPAAATGETEAREEVAGREAAAAAAAAASPAAAAASPAAAVAVAAESGVRA